MTRPTLFRLAWAHAHETLIRAGKKGSRHTFNYEVINSRDPGSQVSSGWRIPPPPQREKRHGRHPTQKPLRLVRRVLLACTREDDLVFDPFSGSGTTAVAAKELNRSFDRDNSRQWSLSRASEEISSRNFAPKKGSFPELRVQDPAYRIA